MSNQQIEFVKKKMGLAVCRHRRITGDVECGLNMEAYISPEVGKCAVEINECADWLRKHDPEFPTSFLNYPTGR